ncbi:PREDICTED: uncharacterized protein LOC108357960 isoform X2 [Rhagoletis zephyria]|uniref:uncharacterized protein LOC108357960 isoform X2 n=1 Tax=Rhagoletis zephyria TaxID=28612 RepID=UPI00081163EE|nr:PREDICTED: uncharacterized protein LOC108357960 isoform X2 [Rhagoletis zephyria]
MDKYLIKQQQVTTNEHQEDESDSDSSPDEATCSKTTKKYQQKLRGAWLADKRLQNWLVQDGAYVRCKYCNCRLKPKVYGLLKHAKSMKNLAAASPFASGNQTKLTYKAIVSDETCKAELANALYVASHTSIRIIDHLTQLQKNVFQDSLIAKNMQLRRTKCGGVIKNVLYPYFKNILMEDIGKNKFSLIIDESTDISVKKYLSIVIRYYSANNGSIVNTFLKLQHLTDCTATGIVGAVENVLREYRLSFKNMVELGTDNASVMVGVNRGVIARVKERNPFITLVPCVCHSIQIAVSTATKCLPNDVEFMVGETYNWFSKSSSRQKHYESIFRAINDDTIPLKITRACDTRWLSIEPAIKRIVDQWVELKCHFGIAAISESCHKAKILSDMFNDINLAYLKFLKPILSEVQKVNKLFESNGADPTKLFSELVRLITSLCNNIVCHFETFDPLTSNIEKYLTPFPYYHYSFEEHIRIKKENNTLNDNIEKTIRITCRDFILKLVYQLRQRLPQNIETLRKLEFLSAENSLKIVKQDMFKYFSDLKVRYSETEIENIELQWKNICSYPWKNVNNTLDFWSEVRQFRNAVGENPFNELTDFVYCLLLLPLSNAEVERTFSAMNIVKTKHRNKMSFAMLNAILAIRYGLKNVQKCCNDFEITEDLIKLMKKEPLCEEEESISDDDNIIDIECDI